MAHGAHDMRGMMDGPLGISHVRMGSGTSWMPDSSPMHANHKMWGDWTAMLHGVAFAEYDHQGSKRGASQFGIIDWEMLMLMHDVGTGKLHLHAMASLEPLTIGSRGYPLLLQTGESDQGQPLHDRQHPHDLIMELAAMFQQPIASNLAVELYGGLAGEPALGPVAFMHRPSAQNDPFAPLGYHWQDATHISYGVLTAGLYSRVWKLEGSWFNGREPNENRWNLDLRRLDSYSGRLTVNPTGRISLAGWYGYLPSPEWLHPDEQVHRYGVSALYGGRGIGGGSWGNMLLWGANRSAGHVENSMAAETNLEIGLKNAVFARAEYVRKSAEELVLPTMDPGREFDIRSLVGGYVREVATIPGGSIGVGGRASVDFVPSALEPYYGTRSPAGVAVYVRVRPKRMASEPAMPTAERGMTGMEHGGELTVPRPNDAHPSMPGMPVMKMKTDSTHRTPPDSTMRGMTHDSTMHPISHDSIRTPTSVPLDSTMQNSHDTTMHAMPMTTGTRVAKPKGSSTSKGSSKSKAASKSKASSRSKASSSSARTTPQRKGRSGTAAPHHGHDMPGMKMPGMQVPADTNRTRKP
ncbi:MAG TPA: hypothetical protein VFP15_03760 [Gemmatimonadaceae bacterium]|nr:hypothetical protein [Gemmatimonadaceae bacterium]